MKTDFRAVFMVPFILLLFVITIFAPVVHAAAGIDMQRAMQADGNQWLLHGRSYDEQRFSPLADINTGNVDDLGLAWQVEIPSQDGLVATPLVVDGIIYLTGSLAKVFAIDAHSGRQLWQFDPGIRLDMGFSNSWTARINRGVAAWGDKVYVGTGDCRLIALDARKGKVVWERETCNGEEGYGITGAPRVANGKVFIGNLGGDTATRGYVTAYDTQTGKLLWRFYTTPGNPAEGFENAAMKMAAETWSGKDWWKGAGGNVWDAIVYDPEFNQLYLGTDSSEPKNPDERSPGGGDNLFTNSIVAIDADTGEYRWHYQTVPRDAWDYNSTNHIILAELEIRGQRRKVLMQAPKNGFFYVLDRGNGELLRADKYVTVTWAEGVDLKSGRPIVSENAHYYRNEDGRAFLYPHPTGGHSWQPMSYNRQTGLVYIPVHDFPAWYSTDVANMQWGTYEVDPDDPAALKGVGKLIAWDPLKGSIRWQVEHDLPLNGGVLSTAGNLVFQGTATGRIQAFAADSGQLLWSTATGSSIQSPPVTYRLGDTQYLLVAAGQGGQARLVFPEYGASMEARGSSRLLAFRLDGKAKLPAARVALPPVPEPPQQFADAATIKRGEDLYMDKACLGCHGAQVLGTLDGSAPDLRYLDREKHGQWQGIVLGGALNHKGMLNYGKEMSEEESKAIQAYVIQKQWELYESRKHSGN